MVGPFFPLSPSLAFSLSARPFNFKPHLYWLVHWLAGSLIGWLAGLFAGLLARWLVGSLTH